MASRTPSKNLWQVPIFFLGCIAASGMYFFHEDIGQVSPNNPDQLMDEARTALAKSPADISTAIAKAGRVIEHSELPSQQLGEAHYLLGCAYLEQSDADSPAKAKHHLEQADILGVPEIERGRLQLRLSKAWLATNTDPQQIIRALTLIAEKSENPYDVYGLLAEAYQRVTPPDQIGLIEATKQQLAHAPPGMDPAKLAEARLRLGELWLAAGNAKEARMILGHVGADASAEIAFKANALLAQCAEESQDWTTAIKSWEALRTNAPAKDKAQALYRLGWAQARAQQLPEAIATLQQATQSADAAWSQAAGIRIAELFIATDAKQAVREFNQALNNVSRPDEYNNAAIPLDDLRALIESVCDRLKTAKDQASAVELATVYAKVALPGRAAELRGQMLASWAEALAAAGNDDATAKWAEAAKAFLAAGKDSPPGPAAVYRLWTAAQSASNGRDFTLALEALNQLMPMQSQMSPNLLAEAWFVTGQVQENLKDAKAAKDAYQRCLAMDPPWRFRARYQLAQVDLVDARLDKMRSNDKALDEATRLTHDLAAQVKFDDAEKMLQENLNELRQSAAPDPSVQELTVYGLGDIAYERGEYANAEPRLKGALQEYPNSPKAIRGHYRLALCIWKRANDVFGILSTLAPNDPKRERTQKEYLDSVAAAIDQYAAVEASLLQKKPLAVDEVEMLRQCGFSLAQLKHFAGRYAEAADAYEVLSRRYEGKVEGLHAIHQLWNTLCNYLNKRDQALQQMERLQKALDKMPDSEFNGTSDIHSREYWQKKLVEMGRQN